MELVDNDTVGVIKPLNEDSSRRLGVGQVVISLASAVKELIENALDAGATSIQITARNQGFDSLEVSDNGVGVRAQDFRSLCQLHQTSKIANFEDLANVGTFGFRGEALNALCGMSDLSITTRHKDDAFASKLVYDRNGNITEEQKCVRLPGTMVTCRNLFCTLPVRRKELKTNLKREWGKLVSTVEAFAIGTIGAHISLSAVVADKKQPVISTHGHRSLRENMCTVFGVKQMETLIPLERHPINEDIMAQFGLAHSDFDDLNIQFSGYISTCEHGKGRSNTDRQFVFVNGRPCDQPKITKSLNDAYHAFNKTQYPVFVLNIATAKGAVDINVTPDKRRLFMVHERQLLVLIRSAAVAILTDVAGSTATLNSTRPLAEQRQQPAVVDVPKRTAPPPVDDAKQSRLERFKFVARSNAKDTDDVPSAKKTPDDVNVKSRRSDLFALPPGIKIESEPTPTTSTSNKVSELADAEMVAVEEPSELTVVDVPPPAERSSQPVMFDMAAWHSRMERMPYQRHDVSEVDCKLKSFDAASGSTSLIEEELTRKLTKTDFEKMVVLGQFNNGFIIARLNDDLFILDQHACDEKHTFETLQRMAYVHSQKLIRPKPVQLSAVGESVLLGNLKIFRKNGFEFTIDESAEPHERIKLESVPTLHNCSFGIEDVEEMIGVLSELPGVMYRPTKLRKIFASRACRKSVMIGTSLTDAQMNRIVKQLAKLDHPWNCPHGRPTLRHLTSLTAEKKT